LIAIFKTSRLCAEARKMLQMCFTGPSVLYRDDHEQMRTPER
jgi:hypothetical protein